jgi:ADP-ribose pyrophosphatase YjhB (NUDIX family)
MFWQNSKPCTCVVLQNENDEVLLCVRGVEPEKGKLDLPGGFLQWGEHPINAIHREIAEELGVEIEIISFLEFVMDSYDNEEVATLNIPFHGRIIRGVPTANDDVAAIVWKRLEDIDPAQLAFQNNREILLNFFPAYRAGMKKSPKPE